MNIGTFLKQLKTPLREEDLIPAKNNYQDVYDDKFHQFLINEFGVSESDIFLSLHDEPLVVLIEKPYAFTLRHMNIDILRFTEEPARYKAMRKQALQMFDRGDYDLFFSLEEDSKTVWLIYGFIKDSLTLEERYMVFKTIYTQYDYGFSQGMINEFLSLTNALNTRNTSFKQILSPHVDEDGYLTVYRGQENHSTDAKVAISWTLSLYTALQFATRHTVDGQIFKGRVHVDHVLEFFDEREEKEIISDQVKDIEPMSSYTAKELIGNLSKGKASDLLEQTYLDTMNMFLGQFDRELLVDEDGIHGYLHTKRVLIHALVLAQKYSLKDLDVFILGYAALYHDIGRKGDEVEPQHGIQSWEKVSELNLVPFEKKEEGKILKFIIENHNNGDARAQRKLKNTPIQNKERAWNLYRIFCDADNLDRVRLGDLDTRYLRMEESYKMLVFAMHCLRNVE